MAYIVSRLDEETQVLIETEPSENFGKDDLEIRPDPERAVFVAVDTISNVCRTLAAGILPSIRGVHASSFEVSFGVKIDGHGSVLVAEHLQNGQFQVQLKWIAAPPKPASG